ncbi:MAG: DHA2 family efflux MFS transporter permease subunit, partial [Syntrophobacterales bacterium]
MTALFIFDPKYIKEQKAGSIDYIGLGVLVVGLGALQVVLDKGEREDWFSSDFIVRLAIISVVALVLLIYWELKTKHPVVDLRLFKERNYASGVTIFFFFGFVLYGSIMLLPLYLQTIMGYDATLAGWALAFGGVGSLMILPIVGRLTQVIDGRWLIGAGLAINALAVFMMSNYNTQVDFFTAWFPRFIQGIGLGTTFVSLTTLTMSRISQEKMGNATGIFNLMRNLGGSFGIATATTLLYRRAQFHQTRLVEHLTPLNLPFQVWQERMGKVFSWLPHNWHWWQFKQPLAGLYVEV